MGCNGSDSGGRLGGYHKKAKNTLILGMSRAYGAARRNARGCPRSGQESGRVLSHAALPLLLGSREAADSKRVAHSAGPVK